MRSLLSELASAFANVYSGWILWNLFLAFIPLALSVWLFRRKSVSKPWFLCFAGLAAFIGVVGFWSRLPWVMRSQLYMLRDALNGDLPAQLKLLWIGAIALMALGINLWMFRLKANVRTWKWWVLLVVFIAFLPNAPYLLTDIIHLIRATSSGQISAWAIALVFIPIHVIAIVTGFEAYVLSLMNQGYYLKQQGARWLVMPSELLIHALSAVGIYLGRFIRFNSWDLVVDPGNVLLTTFNALTDKRPMLVICITFVILTVAYWIMKQITLGLQLRIHYARKGLDPVDILENENANTRSQENSSFMLSTR
ncbi:MAG: DUF1361 domain-containing protein [Cyanobacteria bacterium P01_F01_bin.150]